MWGLFLLVRKLLLPAAARLGNVPSTEESSLEFCVPRGKSGRFAHVFFPLKLLYCCHATYYCLSVRDNTQLQIREKIAMLSQAILPVKRLCHAAPDGQANIPVPWQGTETAKLFQFVPQAPEWPVF